MKFLAFIPALALIGAAQPEAPRDKLPEPLPERPTAEPTATSEWVIGEPDRDPREDCRLTHIAEEDRVIRPRPLDELPDGDGYLAVWRTDERGCPDPIMFELPDR